MRQWIHNLWLKLRLKLFIRHRNYVLTPKGQAILYYLLNKYVNCTKPGDYIENYEDMIFEKDGRFIEQAAAILELNPTLCSEEKDKNIRIRLIAHVFSALQMFETMLTVLQPQLREEWINRITDETIKAKFIKQINDNLTLI